VSVRISLIDYGRLYERMNVAYRDYFSSGDCRFAAASAFPS